MGGFTVKLLRDGGAGAKRYQQHANTFTLTMLAMFIRYNVYCFPYRVQLSPHFSPRGREFCFVELTCVM